MNRVIESMTKTKISDNEQGNRVYDQKKNNTNLVQPIKQTHAHEVPQMTITTNQDRKNDTTEI